jgi:hypothetical protein
VFAPTSMIPTCTAPILTMRSVVTPRGGSKRRRAVISGAWVWRLVGSHARVRSA